VLVILHNHNHQLLNLNFRKLEEQKLYIKVKVESFFLGEVQINEILKFEQIWSKVFFKEDGFFYGHAILNLY